MVAAAEASRTEELVAVEVSLLDSHTGAVAFDRIPASPLVSPPPTQFSWTTFSITRKTNLDNF